MRGLRHRTFFVPLEVSTGFAPALPGLQPGAYLLGYETISSSGRTRTCNITVNSRAFYFGTTEEWIGAARRSRTVLAHYKCAVFPEDIEQQMVGAAGVEPAASWFRAKRAANYTTPQ